MSEPAAGNVTPTAVTIHGRTYNLRGGGDAGYLQELAGLVDIKMREVAETTGTADTTKLAILACLNLADETFQARKPEDAPETEGVDRRLAAMVTLLDEVLAERAD